MQIGRLPQVRIADNVSMPLVGFGTAGLGTNTQQAVQCALQAGYRLLDTAQVSPAHHGRSILASCWKAVPNACVPVATHARRQLLQRCTWQWLLTFRIQKAPCLQPSWYETQAQEWYSEPLVGAGLRDSGVDRRKVFLTSKLHPRHHGYASATRQLKQVD